jgi:hypothetical protein
LNIVTGRSPATGDWIICALLLPRKKAGSSQDKGRRNLTTPAGAVSSLPATPGLGGEERDGPISLAIRAVSLGSNIVYECVSYHPVHQVGAWPV